MPTSFVNSAQFNPAGLTADGLYIRLIPPNGFIKGVQTDVAAIIGTASWGPMNTPILLGSPNDLVQNFGGVTADSPSDPFDMPTDAMIAFGQAQSQSPSTLGIYGVRIGHGSEAKSTFTLLDTAGTPANGAAATAIFHGKKGDEIKLTIAKGAKSNTFDVKVIPFAGAPEELFQGIVGNGNTNANSPFWVNLENAINGGISSVRGPSEYITISAASTTAKDPALGTFTLAGGDDGRTSVDATDLIGDDTARPKTGMYSLRGKMKPPIGVMWLAGVTDTTVYSTIQQFCDTEGVVGLLCLAQGANSTTAIATKKGLGIDDPNIIFVKDWVDIYDSINKRVRRVQPTAVIGGAIACLSPEQSPSNKPVFGVIGTERGGTNQPYLEYSPEELGELASNGIMIVTNPNNGGDYWGLPNGRNSSTNDVQSPVEYARMTNFIAKSLQSFLGKFIGQLQSEDPKDPVRGAVKLTLDSFFEELKTNKQIDSYITQCDLNNNSPDTIAKHYLYAAAKVRYLSSIWYFVVSLEGGTTVVTVQDGFTQQLQ